MDSYKFIKQASLRRMHTLEIEKLLRQSQSVCAFSLLAFAYLANNSDEDKDMIVNIVYDLVEAIFSKEDQEAFDKWWCGWLDALSNTCDTLGLG